MQEINNVPCTADGAGPKDTAAARSSCASEVELAGLLLAHTMQEAEAPIAQLSEALVRVARNLDAGPNGNGRALRTQPATQAIMRDLAVCIENLQFHDRLMQQLARVRDILAALAANRRLADIPAHLPGPAGKSGQGSIELF